MADQPEFVAVMSGSGTTGGDATVTKDGAVQDGHFLVAFITSPNSAANAPTNPDGSWTDHPDSLTAECRLAYKFANGEPASWTWAVPGLSTGQVTVVAFSGVDPLDPIGEIQGTLVAASAGNLVLDGLTPTAEYLFQMVVKHVGTAQTWTPPGTTSEDYDQQSAGSPTYAIGGGHELVTPGVATGTRTWDPSNTGNNSIRGYLLTLNKIRESSGAAFLGLI